MEDPKLPESTGSTNDTASATEVKKVVETPDYEAILVEKDNKISRLSTDRDNYRAGMLKYKKLADENPDDESLNEERIKQMIKQELVDSEIFKEQSEKDAIIKTIAIENKELKIALANKSQISNMPGGASGSEETIKTDGLTAEQQAHFDRISKEIGVKIDPKKFLENYNRINK